jgi:hypothetical protein
LAVARSYERAAAAPKRLWLCAVDVAVDTDGARDLPEIIFIRPSMACQTRRAICAGRPDAGASHFTRHKRGGLAELDTNKIDQAVLALLALGRHEGYRTWKAFDWEVMGRLHQKGYISDPVGKVKSVLFTEDGARESERLLQVLFGREPDRDSR